MAFKPALVVHDVEFLCEKITQLTNEVRKLEEKLRKLEMSNEKSAAHMTDTQMNVDIAKTPKSHQNMPKKAKKKSQKSGPNRQRENKTENDNTVQNVTCRKQILNQAT